MAEVTVRFWAAAKAAAGTAEEHREAATLGELVEELGAEHGPVMARVLQRCSFLVDGERGLPGTALDQGVTVEVLPPFAGG